MSQYGEYCEYCGGADNQHEANCPLRDPNSYQSVERAQIEARDNESEPQAQARPDDSKAYYLDDNGGVDFSNANIPDCWPIKLEDLVWVGNTLQRLASFTNEEVQGILNGVKAPERKLDLKSFSNLINSLYDASTLI